MDKSGRRALTENVARMIQAAKNRHSWATAHRLDPKAVERLEKDAHGEKGVSISYVDELAAKLRLEAWQLLVPDLDHNAPPGLTTGQPRPAELPVTLGGLALAVAAAFQHLDKRRRDGVADALARMLKEGPDETEAHVIDAWTGGMPLPFVGISHTPNDSLVREDLPAAPLVTGIAPGRAAATSSEESCQEQTETRPEPSSGLAKAQQTPGRNKTRRRQA